MNYNEILIICSTTAITTDGDIIYPHLDTKSTLEVLLSLSVVNQEIYLDILTEKFEKQLKNDNSILSYGEIETIAEIPNPINIEVNGAIEQDRFSQRLRGLYGRTDYS